MNINQLIESREEEIRAAKETKEARKTEAVDKLLSEMKEFLGEFYTFLEDRYQKTGEKYILKWETNNEDIPIRIFYNLPAMPEEELAPIVIKWGPHAMSAPNYYDYQQKFSVGNNYYPDLKSALRAAREAYPKYLEESKREAMKSFKNALPSWKEGSSEEVALKVLDAHVKLHPDLEEESRAHYAEWKESRESEIRRREEYRRDEELKEAKAALRKTLRFAYLRDLAEWMKERDAIEESNRKAAAAIQEINDSISYIVYKVSYAVVAEYSEDGEIEHILETRSAYTFGETAIAGYWKIGGKDIRYPHVYEVERMKVKPSDGILSKWIDREGVDIHFAPETPDETIEEAFTMIKPLPVAPRIPAELSGSYTDNIWTRAARAYLESGFMLDPDEAIESAYNDSRSYW